jgi:hypothetical protein
VEKLAMVVALATAGIAAGCSDGNGVIQPVGSQPARKAMRAEVDGYYGNYVDTLAVARLAGYDYLAIVTDCLLRDEKAMQKLFEMTATVPFDAASAEGNSEVLGFILRDVGDRFFGKCLSTEESAVQRAVREALLYDLGCDGDYEAKGQHIHRLYPHTYPNPNGL